MVCNGTPLSPELVIPAGTPAGSVSYSFDNIPTGSMCTVMETVRAGATATVAATVSGNDQTGDRPGGRGGNRERDGRVRARRPRARGAGPVRLAESDQDNRGTGRPPSRSHLDPCRLWQPALHLRLPHPSPHRPRFCVAVLPRPPGRIPITVTETTDGHTATVAVGATGRHHKVTIAADSEVTVHITDTFLGVRAVSVTG